MTYLLDPRIAMLRCWDHEDCLENLELAFACAAHTGTITMLGGEIDDDWACRFAAIPNMEQEGPPRFSMPGDGRGVPVRPASGNQLLEGDGVGYPQMAQDGSGDWYGVSRLFGGPSGRPGDGSGDPSNVRDDRIRDDAPPNTDPW